MSLFLKKNVSHVEVGIGKHHSSIFPCVKQSFQWFEKVLHLVILNRMAVEDTVFFRL